MSRHLSRTEADSKLLQLGSKQRSINHANYQNPITFSELKAPPTTKEGDEGQAKDSSAEKKQGEQDMQEQVKQQVIEKEQVTVTEKEQVMDKVQEQEGEKGVEVRSEDCNAVMRKVWEQTSEVGLNQ